MKDKGFIHVYTGNGKGKTTAALGLALRAAGAGKTVYVAQFVKGMKYSELKSLGLLKKHITVRQCGLRGFIVKTPSKADIDAACKGLAEAAKAIASGRYDLVILDEANIANYYNLFTARELLDVVLARPVHVEIVITGRYADKKIMDAADLITEMREVRHYYSKGVPARKGIEK
ncbi:MAG: cob(I)yrinic acid a,c-diamide adenosyltransferase [Fibrobacterota bacterium]